MLADQPVRPSQVHSWLRAMRRIDRVTLRIADGGVTATLSGVGYRLPVERQISVSTALALRDAGVPLTVETAA